MIPVAFDYVEASSVEHALALFAENDDAKFLAGGHSLVPMMKLRIVSPNVLIDIGRIKDLSYIEDRNDHIAVGALTSQCLLENSSLLAKHVGLLGHVAGQIGDPQVRNRGTIGGSLVHGDPAADLPAAALALGASMVITGVSGSRVVKASEFFVNFLETVVGDGELLTEIRFPKRTGDGWAYQKFNRRAMDYAIVAVAVQLGSLPGIALVNMGSTPHFAAAASEALAQSSPSSLIADLVIQGTEAWNDGNATREYREHLARVLTTRALTDAGYKF
jgi:carbon-monoxide dehydrogenase medium subunit